MYSPVTRLLAVLHLLQSRPSMTSAQLADRLQVNTRSVRRYITMLQDLGIPIEAERGRYGGYRLRPGYQLPPLMWTEDEAVAITLGLQAAEQLGMAKIMPTIENALAKVERLLPLALQECVEAFQKTVVLDLGGEHAVTTAKDLSTLCTAAFRGERVSLRYRAKSGQLSERKVDCYHLLYQSKRWCVLGFCHLRQHMRIFRLDHILSVERCDEQFVRPATFDALNYALQSFAAIPEQWLIEVLLDTTLTQIQEAVPTTFATLEETSSGLFLRAYDNDLNHTARFLVRLGCPFRVINPPELIEALQRLASTILDQVRCSSPVSHE